MIIIFATILMLRGKIYLFIISSMKTYKKILFIIIWLAIFLPFILADFGYELQNLGISETYFRIFFLIWLTWFMF